MQWYRLANIPIALRVSLAPLLALLSLVLNGFLVDSVISEFSATTKHVGRDRFEVSSDASSDLNATLMELYYVLAAADTGQDVKTSQQMLDDVAARLAMVKTNVMATSRKISATEGQHALEAVAENLGKFDQPIRFVKGMLEIDAHSAVSFLEPLRQNLGPVRKSLSDAADDQRSRAAQAVIVLEHRAARSRSWSMMVSAVGQIAQVSVVPAPWKNRKSRRGTFRAMSSKRPRAPRPWQCGSPEFLSRTERRGSELAREHGAGDPPPTQLTIVDGVGTMSVFDLTAAQGSGWNDLTPLVF